jgi:UDP-2-acetamido-3-amino-2,3-dideoxy-glucuronate N-acetyltransferase
MKKNNWNMLKFTLASDFRGDLVAIDFEKQLPFSPKRFFYTFNVPNTALRGEHAHIECEQVLIAIAGKIRVLLNDGSQNKEFILDDPAVGLYVPKFTWASQESQTSSSILGVFASHVYEESDYIRNFDSYIELVRQHELVTEGIQGAM